LLAWPFNGCSTGDSGVPSQINIDEVYSKIRTDSVERKEVRGEQSREAFWRELNQSNQSGFDTIAQYFARGVIQ